MSLIQINLIFLFLFFIFFLYGRAIFRIYSLISGKNHSHVLGVEVSYFYLLLGIAFYCNLLVLLNFFLPLKNSLFVFGLSAVILLFNLEKKIEFKFNLKTFAPILFFPLIFSFYNNTPSSDAFMYHFQNQRFIFEEKIVFGLSNLFPNLGFVSIIEYFSVFFWTGENFTLVGLVNILFIAGFYYFIIGLWDSKNLQLKNISIVVLLVSLLDNFGYGGGRNGYIFIQEIGKFDASFGIIFFICFVLIYIISQKPNLNDIDIHVAFLLVFFLGQIKSTGYILFFPLFIIVFLKKRFYIFKAILKNYFLIFISFIWIVRSLINSACLIFPVNFTCLPNLKWYFPEQAKLLSQGVISNNRNPESPYIAYGNYDWIKSYWYPENKSYLLNFLITTFLIFFITWTKKKTETNKEHIILIVISLVNFLVWFLLFPNYRFSVGFFLSLYIALLYKNLMSENILLRYIQKSKFIFLIILFTSVVFVVRLDSYKVAINDFNQNIIEKYVTPFQIYEIRNDSFGVRPLNGSCITNTGCSTSSYGVSLFEFSGYKMFIPLDVNYNLRYLSELENFLED